MKHLTVSSLFLFIFVACLGFSQQAASAEASKFKLGKTYHGFKLTRIQRVEEIDALSLVFEHKRSGARLVKFETDDDNKSFCIAFRTPPDADTGLPHILEHSVLNGSKKFPVKSPFDILAQGSLNTFLNAMTSSDFTMYPVASTNTKDFFNLVDVYLDAVLNPRIHQEPKIFMQEGWHYEMEDPDGDMTINGIVYNEMKGAFSSPGRVLDWVTSKALFPDTPYGRSSGGHPDHIPELTGKLLNNYHKKHYHPANSYITLWGDGDTLAELKFIDSKYLKSFKRKKIDTSIPLQKAFDAPREVNAEYPIAANEKPDDKTYLSMNYVAGGAVKPGLSMSLDVLSDVLVNLPAAPLRKALLKAKIGKDVYATYDSIKQGVFSIVVKNANAADKERFQQVVKDTLSRVVAEGLDKKSIEGSINKMEFQLREADYGGFPKGLVYTYFGLRGWMFADDPFLTIAYEAPLKEVRKALTEKTLEGLIQTHLLDNPHSVFSMAQPKPGLEDEYAKALAAKLAAKKDKLSKKARVAIVEQTKALKAYQIAKDKPGDIAKIPMLALSDLTPTARRVEGTLRKLGETKVVHFDHATNGIIYLRVLFDASVVPQELVPLLPLLAELLGQMDTKTYTYGALDNELNIHTGGLGFSVSTYPKLAQREQYQPKLSTSAKVLTPKFAKLVELQTEIVKRTRIGDKKRLAEVIDKHNSQLQGMARGAGSYLASQRLGSYLSPVGRYGELTGGLSYIQFVAALAKDFDARSDDLIADLDMLAGLVFNRNNLVIGVTCNQADYAVFEKHAPALIDALSSKASKVQEYVFDAPAKNEGLLAASKVQYVNQGANFIDQGFDYTGQLRVLSQILSRVYLTQNIRVQGGAYGAWAMFTRTGFSLFGSYRDPNLQKTLDVFAGLPAYLKAFEASDREMDRFVIGTIAKLDKPLTPSILGQIALSDYMQGLSYAEHQKERDAVLATRQADIIKLTDLVKAVLDKSLVCVYGNEKILKDNKKLFERLVEVIQ